MQSTTDNLQIIDPVANFEDNADGLLITLDQHIPQTFLDGLKDARLDPDHAPMGEFYRFASIPVAVWDEWIRRGIDVNHLSIKEVMRLLQKQQLDNFITTTKQLY